MRSDRLFLLAALGGAATFAAALYFQYVQGLAPCKLCIVQRYGLGLGIGAALLAALVSNRKASVALGGLAVAGFLFEMAAAVYHTGVERKWWEGPASCSGSTLTGGGGFDPDRLSASLAKGTPPPRCDEIPWDFLGLSMANWNVPIALGFAVLCMMGIARLRRDAFGQG